MKLEISQRLKKIVDMVGCVKTVADIASDHGYVPITLLNNDKIEYAIATDINNKPIENLKKNIELYLNKKKQDLIEVRIGDGLKVLKKNEVEVIIISGIGYDLMADILSNIEDYDFKFLILSSQSKFYQFRKFLHEKKLKIIDEVFLIDDNKEYFIQKVIKEGSAQKFDEECFYMYSEILLKNKNKELYHYITKKINRLNQIIPNININNEKYCVLKNELEISKKALEYYGEKNENI